MIAAALAYWTHDLDPVAFRFPEGWGLRGVHWYGLAYAAGFWMAGLALTGTALVGAVAVRAAGFLAGDFKARLLWVPIGWVSGEGVLPPVVCVAAGDSSSARECTGKPSPKPIQ